MFWANQKTGEIEQHEKLPPVERIKEFIPQIDSAQKLYAMYTENMNKDPAVAMRLVLEASLGIKST